jgi:hypothetical protein
MPIEAFANVFFQFKDFTIFYSADDVMKLASYYTYNKGKIDIQTMVKQLH